MDEYLRAAIRARHWTIPQFAEACDVAVGLAQKWVSENPRYRAKPGPASCEKIAAALNVDPDYLLELAGHRRPRAPREQITARRQAVRDQLDRWLNAVGPDYEELFWRSLKDHGDTAARTISAVRTAVSGTVEPAVSAAVSGHAGRGRRRRVSSNGPLAGTHHTIERLRATAQLVSERPAA